MLAFFLATFGFREIFFGETERDNNKQGLMIFFWQYRNFLYRAGHILN